MYQVKREDANWLLMELGYVDAEEWSDQKAADLLAELADHTDQQPKTKEARHFLRQLELNMRIFGTFELLAIAPKANDFKVVLTAEEVTRLQRELQRCNLATSEGINRWRELNGGDGVQVGNRFLYATGASRTMSAIQGRIDFFPPDKDPYTRAKVVELFWRERAALAKKAFDEQTAFLKSAANRGSTPSKNELDQLTGLRESVVLARKNHNAAIQQVKDTDPQRLTPKQERERAKAEMIIQEQRHRALEELDRLSRI